MPVLLVLFLAFITIPLVEIYLLIEVGSRIGALWTVTLVLGTAVLGAGLLRQQGLSTLNEIQRELSQGRLPAVAMVEGMLLLLTGALLLTPGFATDFLGFLLLVPVLRQLVANWIIHKQLLKAGVNGPFGTGHGPQSGPDSSGHNTLDGDYERLDD